MSFSVCVQTQDFDIAKEYADLIANTPAGAIVFFVGLVRDFSSGVAVSSLQLEHYPGMTEQSLKQFMDEAQARWPLLAARIVHRVGHLNAGDQIVFVAAASEHRADAFKAAEFLMDVLKTKAPFWKKEVTLEGEFWVESKNSDQAAAERWRLEGRG